MSAGTIGIDGVMRAWRGFAPLLLFTTGFFALALAMGLAFPSGGRGPSKPDDDHRTRNRD